MTNTWLTKICTSASFVFALIFLPQLASAQVWGIDAWDSAIEVHESGQITVEETISTNFYVEKHGIFRSIPVVYKDNFGQRVKIKLNVVSVMRDGQPESYEVYREGANKVIKIGDPDVTISGDHIYSVKYTVDRAILFFDDHDELYWNVTDTEENAEVFIYNATAAIVLPEGVEATAVDCYTSYTGSQRQDCGVATEGNVIGVAAEDFLTVAVGIPKGVISEPTFWDKIGFFIEANALVAIPLAIILIVFIVWWYFGRDPKMRKTVIAEYEPPQDLWPAYAGFMTKGSVTKWQIASMVVQLAVKGYLKFKVEEDGKTIFGKQKTKTTLIKLKESTGLDEIHKILFEEIFKKRNEIDVAKLKGKVSSQKMHKVTTGIRKHLEDEGYYTKSGFIFRGIIIAIAVVLGYFTFAAGLAFGLIVGASFLLATIVVIIFAILMPKMTPKGIKVLRHVLGFKLFMHTAERYRSEWQENKNIFTDYLPYAIAFHDVDRWAKAFEGLEQNNPDWYDSRMPFTNAAVFATNLTNVTNSFTAAASPQRTAASSGSSGLGGGGFSGGGFGGGSTGSW